MSQVSVVVPLYNKSRYIGRALGSILNQTYRDFEVIVVDDGSTDDGPEIVRRCSDGRVRMIQQENAGPGAARNRGVKEATSSLIAFLDADDEWLPAYLERTVQILAEHPECAAATSAYFLGMEKVDVTGTFQRRGIAGGTWGIDRCGGTRELRNAVYTLHSSTTTIRRGVVEMYGGFYEKGRCKLGEDYYLWVQVLFGHDIYWIPEPLVWYHTEASELAVGPKINRALEPVLTDPEPIRRKCPPDRRARLELWLAQFALATAHELTTVGDTARAAWLIGAFPSMRKSRWGFTKLRFKLAVPGLVPHIRKLKKLVDSPRSV